MALNKDAIVKGVWQGAYSPTYHIVPHGMSGYNPNLTGPDGTALSVALDGLTQNGVTFGMLCRTAEGNAVSVRGRPAGGCVAVFFLAVEGNEKKIVQLPGGTGGPACAGAAFGHKVAKNAPQHDHRQFLLEV